MHRLTSLVLCCVLSANIFHFVESAPHHSKTFKRINQGFLSFVCRLRHKKTIIDVNRRPIGCARGCPKNYEEKYSLRWGHHCTPIILPDKCADKFCIQCLPGYKWFYTFPPEARCITECPIGYADNGIVCEKCLTRGCARCSDAYTCTRCGEGFALHQPVFSFRNRVICKERCPKGYKKIKIQGVVKCVMNRMTTEKIVTQLPTTKVPTTIVVPTTKEALPPGCMDKDCLNCIKGFIKFISPDGGWQRCINQCPQGYTNVTSICVACSDRRCASCESSMAECEKCFPRYKMLLDAANNTLECVLNCPKQHQRKVINNATVCIPKPKPDCPVSNCKRCIRPGLQVLHGGCEECDNGFKLFRGTFSDHCYTSCPSGYFPRERPGTKIATCAKCEVPFCSKCLNGATCQECIGPLVLDSFGRCTTCPPKQSYSFEEKRCLLNKKTIATEGKEVVKDVIFELADESA